jgi:hypothetical protein
VPVVIVILTLLAVLLRSREGHRERQEAAALQENDWVWIGAGFYRIDRRATPKTRELTLCVDERQGRNIIVKTTEILIAPAGSKFRTPKTTVGNSESAPPKRPEGLAG